jgi:hypothetical protein
MKFNNNQGGNQGNNQGGNQGNTSDRPDKKNPNAGNRTSSDDE